MWGSDDANRLKPLYGNNKRNNRQSQDSKAKNQRGEYLMKGGLRRNSGQYPADYLQNRNNSKN